MMTKIEKLPKSTYKIHVEVPKEQVLRVKSEILKELAKKTKLPGFRPGKVPSDVLEKDLDKNFLQKEVLNHLLTTSYTSIVKEHHLRPITKARFELKEWRDYETLKFEIRLAEKPDIKIGDYWRILKEKESPEKIDSNAVLKAILDATEAEIPDILIEDEVTRMLGNLLDQVTQLGLTIEKYLQSKNKTVEQLKREYTKKAQESLKVELALNELINEEKLEVSDKEIEEAIKVTPDEKSRNELAKDENKWYIKTILSRQKLIQKIIKQVEEKV